MFTIRLFGGASVQDGTGSLKGRAVQRHRLALLALLAISHPRPVARDRLLAYLWPERNAEQARGLLNQAVHALRKALGEGAILSTGDELQLCAEVVACDVIGFSSALQAGDRERAVGLYAGPFLDGFFLSDAPEFERWVEGERERLRRVYCQALEGLAAEAAARGDSCRAAEWWRRLATEEPYNGRVTLRLMEALEAAGDRAGALQQARVHTLLLQEEFAAEPDPAVSALAERLRAAPIAPLEPSAAPAAAPPLREGRNSLPAVVAPKAEAGETTLPAPRAGVTPRRRPWPVHRWGVALGLLGLGALAVPLTVFWLRAGSAPVLHPQRVVVAPFENRTGDTALDPLGSMAADWITQGISQTGIVEVVTPSAALVSARHVRGAVAENTALDPVRALAEETGAGLVISGAYYLVGDSLRFQARITDAGRRRVLRALEPLGAPVSAPMPAIELLRQRALAALAPLLDPRLAAHGQRTSQPPSYEAYRAYAEGMEVFTAGRWHEATPHFERAAATDSTYLLPRLLTASALINLRRFAEADSLTQLLNRSRERLAPYERALLDMMMTWLRDDPVARYETAKHTAALAPGSLPHVQWAAEALRLNRPREAIAILSQIDPTRGEVRGWPAYWEALLMAHHLLGDHRRELTEARRARALHPDDPRYLWLEARARVALGRLPDVEALIDARLAAPAQRAPHPGLMMFLLARELRAHGHVTEAKAMYDRTITWHEGRPVEERGRNRVGLGLALIGAERWQEAQVVFEQLAAEDPERSDHQGMLGALAAQRGDRAEAERISAWLAAHDDPYRRGEITYLRACIAAQLGQKDQAVTLLRAALGQGSWVGSWSYLAHVDFFLDPLRDYPPFRELMRPKG